MVVKTGMRTRMGEWAYLLAIAVMAVLVGAGLTALSRTDGAQRGMNGVLAWMQDTGMPMRPAMSVMMTTETDPRDAHDVGLDIDLEVPDDVEPGRPADLTITIRHAETGAPVEDVGRSHEAWMHLITTRDDLGTFAHLHPEPNGRPGEFTVTNVFPTAGRYLVHTEFRRQGQMTDVVDRHEVVVGDPRQQPTTSLHPRSRHQVIAGVRVDLHGTAIAGEESRLTFEFSDAATGAPVDDLRPYLAAPGHVVVMPADASGFAHEHAEVEDPRGRPVFALPGQQYGPELDFHTHFDEPGTYRLWGQFRLADGSVITAPFTIEARGSGPGER